MWRSSTSFQLVGFMHMLIASIQRNDDHHVRLLNTSCTIAGAHTYSYPHCKLHTH
jgi:hypothetical protein